MEEAGVEAFKGKLVRGVFALTARTFILQLISFISTFLLTVLLSPSVFGVFFIVSAVISFLSYFSDFGLAAALIQKKEEPTRDELVSAFTMQQILIGSICVAAFILSSSVASYYSLDISGVFLFRALIISFFLSSLKTIPSVLLERKLQFELLVIPQILETASFYLIALALAFLNFGVVSFAWAALIRGIVGLIAIYAIYPWPIGIGFSYSSIKHLLNFGIPFQANSLLAFVKDDLMTLFLGKILPIAHVGYLGWAKKWAEAPLRLIMDNIIRVTFPAYARLQHDKVILGKAIGKSVFFLGLLIFPSSILLILFINPMTALIPKYSKWAPAVFAFYLYTVSAILSSFSSPMVNALSAIGKIKQTLGLMIVWTLLTWILVPMLSLNIGFNGAAIAAAIISTTAVIPIILVRKIVYFPILSSIYKPLVSTLVMILPVYFILSSSPSWTTAAIAAVLGISIYGLLIWFWMKQEISPYLPRRQAGLPKFLK